MSIRVLVADDSEIICRPIVRLLETEASIQLVGRAASFAETLEMTAALKPDVLLMDVHMPDELNYAPASVASELLLSTKRIVAMSMWINDETKERAASLGSCMLLDKCNLGEELIPAILQSADTSTHAATA
jgi:DNA-binding NarL/FixJ family response regulator